MCKYFLILTFFFSILLQAQNEGVDITDQQEREILQQLIALDEQSFQVIHHYLVLSARANINAKPPKNIVLYTKLLPIAQKNLFLFESIFNSAEYLRQKKSDSKSTNEKTLPRSFETIVTELNMARDAIKITQLIEELSSDHASNPLTPTMIAKFLESDLVGSESYCENFCYMVRTYNVSWEASKAISSIGTPICDRFLINFLAQKKSLKKVLKMSSEKLLNTKEKELDFIVNQAIAASHLIRKEIPEGKDFLDEIFYSSTGSAFFEIYKFIPHASSRENLEYFLFFEHSKSWTLTRKLRKEINKVPQTKDAIKLWMLQNKRNLYFDELLYGWDLK